MSSLPQTTPSPLTLAAEPGIGTTKSAFPAPTDGSSTPTRSVCPFLTNALQATVLEPALLAMKVMTSRTELASSLPSTMPTQLTSVALLGTGNSKSALPAPRDGSSTPTRPACQSMTTATPTMKTVPALHATKATVSTTDSVCQSTLSARLSMLMDHALLAILRTFFTTDHVFLSTSLPTSCSTTLPAALKSLPNSKNRKENDFIRFMNIL